MHYGRLSVLIGGAPPAQELRHRLSPLLRYDEDRNCGKDFGSSNKKILIEKDTKHEKVEVVRNTHYGAVARERGRVR